MELAGRSGRVICGAFFAFMAAAQVYGTLRAHPWIAPRSSRVAALAGYVLLAALAAWVERRAVGTHAR